MSEPNGAGPESGVALEPLTADVGPVQDRAAASHESWFEPASPPAEYEQAGSGQLSPGQDDGFGAAGRAHEGAVGAADAGTNSDSAGDESRHADEWFLPTGRAGLRPDSISESWDEGRHVPARQDTSGAPPWAGEQQPDQDIEEPPPWESGPWPGPGEERPQSRRRPAASGSRAARMPTDDTGNWQAIAALAAGIVPLLLPGAVLGVLGLRRARSTGTGRAASWAGIGLSLISALVLLIVVLASVGDQSAQGCSGASQADVSNAMASVLRDLAASAPKSVVTADLDQAIGQANAAAAAAQQVSGRDALATLTTGLQQALAEVTAGHPAAYAAIRTQLVAENAAVTTACKA
jgi:hypothetical protein